ncbi:MAG: excinuclease ABC subunit UvrA [Paludibacteraceae bacterium]|nr:excinuclease ABC subunit UvrA [Paludibacteraceae bacterium]
MSELSNTPIIETEQIDVIGARVHNLKNIDVSIPRNSLTVITGLSGSGKSSLAFDTIYAEGQRRYIETFSAYARGFLGALERPDVDKISGLSPVISIEQKTTNKNPRSTVGTTTEIYDYLRLLFARAGVAYSYITGEPMIKYSEEQIIDLIIKDYEGKRIYLLAPLVRNRKGHYKELFEQIRKKGYMNVRVDGEIHELTFGMRVDRYKNHDIEVVIDKLQVNEKDRKRLKESVAKAMQQGNGIIMIIEHGQEETRFFSRSLMCPTSGISYNEPAPHNFSFNSPQGACPHCQGLGLIDQIDINKVIPDKKISIYSGGIEPLGKYRNTTIFWQIESILEQHGCNIKTPICDLPEEALQAILYGTGESIHIKNAALGNSNYFVRYEGIINHLKAEQENAGSAMEIKQFSQYAHEVTCPECQGARLRKEALHFRIGTKNIAEMASMDITDLMEYIDQVEPTLNARQQKIAAEILKEIRSRLQFMLNVGLQYLSLNRSSQSLSGGESQRIRLATQIGSDLVNVLYILDEPSIGLHQRDNIKLIHSLKNLRDAGNTVIVVEHDESMMREADYVIDLGPHAGRLGGEVVFAGTPTQMLQSNTLTAKYLNQQIKIQPKTNTRIGNGHTIHLYGATGNNLKHVDLEIPLGKIICVTGVSGSGKSTLINSTLHPILSQHFYRSTQQPLPYERIEGIEHIDKVVQMDQSPIGRTPRSNPATYTGVFNEIRNLFTSLPEAKIRGYKPGRFSFNTAGGRCETCGGNGYKTIEMNFLPDVYVPCEICAGKRYNRETLEVRFKGKSIADVLDMTINQAVEFFENQPTIIRKIKTLQEVGLGYIKLGQPSTTLSGGESQRVKLATELSKRDTGKTLYILDEPTTGLHFEDIRVLLDVLHKLADKGNTILIIEHNLDVIKCADHIIDMGPEGGKNGGQIIATGTPSEIANNPNSITGEFLKELI